MLRSALENNSQYLRSYGIYKGHYVGTPEGIGKKLHGPVDIEAHKGTDDRYYVVDFARTFPPERPAPEQ